MINNAEIVLGVPFVQLKYVVEWKKQFRRKNIKNIKLIRKYDED